MASFPDDFLDRVAGKLDTLLLEARKPYAAVLYECPKHEPLTRETGRIVASAYNTEETSGNSNDHAEINVLDMSAKILSEVAWLSPGKLRFPDDREREFWLFVNTRPCPKCTAAILDVQIFFTLFFWENNYMEDVATSIKAAKEQDLQQKLKTQYPTKPVNTEYFTLTVIGSGAWSQHFEQRDKDWRDRVGR